MGLCISLFRGLGKEAGYGAGHGAGDGALHFPAVIPFLKTTF